MKRGPLYGADDRPRIHVWPHAMADRYRFSFGPMGNRSQQQFKTIGEAVEGARMHAGGFEGGAVIIIEAQP